MAGPFYLQVARALILISRSRPLTSGSGLLYSVSDADRDPLPLPPFYKNGFLVACEDTREAVLIDPGDEVAELLRIAESGRMTVRYILLTHAHMDHVSGVAAAKRATGAPIGVHRDDLFLYESAVQQGALLRLHAGAAAGPGLLLRTGHADRVRALRGPRAPHAGPQPGRRLPARHAGGHGGDAPVRRRHAVRAVDRPGPICRAATTRRSWPRFEPCCSGSGTRRSSTRGTARTRPSATSAARIHSCRNEPPRRLARLRDRHRVVRGGELLVERDRDPRPGSPPARGSWRRTARGRWRWRAGRHPSGWGPST